MHIDPHPIRTAIGVIRGALWLQQQGASRETSHELLEHGLTRLKAASEEVLAEYRDLMAELDGRPGVTIWFARMAIAFGIKRVRRRALRQEMSAKEALSAGRDADPTGGAESGEGDRPRSPVGLVENRRSGFENRAPTRIKTR